MKVKVLERRGKKHIILFPDNKTERELINGITDKQTFSMIVRKSKFTDSYFGVENVLVIQDSHKKSNEKEG